MNASRGGSPIKWNDCLGDLATSHSQDMKARSYYGHGTQGDPKSFMVFARAASAGLVTSGSFNEDVLSGDLQNWMGGDIANAVDMWMSDDHRIPILGCDEVGVGIASTEFMGATSVIVTADFICPKGM